MNEKMDEGLASLVTEIKELHRIIRRELPSIKRRSEEIINNKITSTQIIERELDSILNLLYLGFGTEEFQRLNEYYVTISKENAAEYMKFYEEVVNNDYK